MDKGVESLPPLETSPFPLAIFFLQCLLNLTYLVCVWVLPNQLTFMAEAAHIASLHALVFAIAVIATAMSIREVIDTYSPSVILTPVVACAPLLFSTLANALLLPTLGLESWLQLHLGSDFSVLLIVQTLALAESAGLAITAFLVISRMSSSSRRMYASNPDDMLTSDEDHRETATSATSNQRTIGGATSLNGNNSGSGNGGGGGFSSDAAASSFMARKNSSSSSSARQEVIPMSANTSAAAALRQTTAFPSNMLPAYLQNQGGLEGLLAGSRGGSDPRWDAPPGGEDGGGSLALPSFKNQSMTSSSLSVPLLPQGGGGSGGGGRGGSHQPYASDRSLLLSTESSLLTSASVEDAVNSSVISTTAGGVGVGALSSRPIPISSAYASLNNRSHSLANELVAVGGSTSLAPMGNTATSSSYGVSAPSASGGSSGGGSATGGVPSMALQKQLKEQIALLCEREASLIEAGVAMARELVAALSGGPLANLAHMYQQTMDLNASLVSQVRHLQQSLFTAQEKNDQLKADLDNTNIAMLKLNRDVTAEKNKNKKATQNLEHLQNLLSDSQGVITSLQDRITAGAGGGGGGGQSKQPMYGSNPSSPVYASNLENYMNTMQAAATSSRLRPSFSVGGGASSFPNAPAPIETLGKSFSRGDETNNNS